jgi:ketosteroid isomerase-like protein
MKFLLCGLLSSALLAPAQECDPQETAKAMLENETKFVAKGQEEGTRAASLAFLADDAIMFDPGPVNAKKTWTARPETPLSLKWQPAFAAMARSCDLAFTTGPAEWRKNKEDEKPLGYGQYVSIWKKQKDGVWKVAVDVGGSVPSAQKIEGLPELSISNAPVPQKPDAAAAAKKLREAEKWFVNTAKTDSTAALVGSSAEMIHVHRDGVSPAVGREPANLMLSVRRGQMTVERIGGDISQAGDLAYSYGKYSVDQPQKTERGFYLQIWQTDPAGAWKLLLDYQSPVRPEIKKIGE